MNDIRSQNYSTTWLEGLVVDNLDPVKAKRVKIRVAGVHDDIEDKYLPWARCTTYAGRGSNASADHVCIPMKGAKVNVQFQQGDPQNPMYLGGVASSNNVPALFKINYPNRSGWLLPNGTYMVVDETSGDILINHQGITIQVDKNHTTTVNNSHVIVNNGNVTVNSGTVHVNGGDVIADGISLKNHDHISAPPGDPTSKPRIP